MTVYAITAVKRLFAKQHLNTKLPNFEFIRLVGRVRYPADYMEILLYKIIPNNEKTWASPALAAGFEPKVFFSSYKFFI